MAIIINYDLPDNITVNILPTGETVVNVLPKSTIVVNLCNDNGQSTTDYAALTGKPKINDVELIGNKTLTQLGIEPKRGADDFYVTNAEKTQGALATGNSALDTVKKVADRTDRLLVNYIVPSDTPSLTFDTDKYGNSFDSIELKSIRCILYFRNNALNSIFSRIRVNDVNTTTYKNTGNVADGLMFRTYRESITYVDIDILGQMLVFDTSTASSGTLLDDSTLGQHNFEGRNNSISFNQIKKIFIFNPTKGIDILAGSIIKIYRND